MASMTCSMRFARVALVALGIAVASCSNPPGRASDGERSGDPGPAGFQVEMGLEDVLKVVDPAWTANDPATNAAVPAPRDWLKNLVGQGSKADPGAPSP